MKIRELFDRVLAIPGMRADEDMMLMWLNDCEGIIFEEMIATREDAPLDRFDGYDEDDTEVELLAKNPYSVLYVHWLCAQIYLSFADMARYNNSIALYRDAYEEFAGWYARGHRAKRNTEVKL